MSAPRQVRWWVVALGIGLAWALATCPLAAQWLDPDRRWDRDQWEHVAAGAAINLALWPVLKPSLNRPLPRVLLACTVGAAYEGLQLYEARASGRSGTGYGFSLLDLGAGCAGAAALELLVAGGRRVLR